MKCLPIITVACVAVLAACTVKEERTVQQPVPTSTVVSTPTPAPSTTVYTTPAPAATTTVYTR